MTTARHHPGLGERLRNLRSRRELTQVTLSARSGVALATIGLAERLDHATTHTVERLAAALGVSPAELVGSKHPRRARETTTERRSA